MLLILRSTSSRCCFFKRISDVCDGEYRAALAEPDEGEAYAALPEMHRFEIPLGCHWKDVRETTTNVGLAIEKALRGIEQANQEYLYGIFGDAQWSNKNKLSDALLINLIEHFSQYELSNETVDPDMLGQAYEYLIKHFADLTNKKAGEFYPPRSVVHLLGLILDQPFSLKDWGAENWANDPFGRNMAGVPPNGNGDIAWVQHMIKSMNSTGRMTVVERPGLLREVQEAYADLLGEGETPEFTIHQTSTNTYYYVNKDDERTDISEVVRGPEKAGTFDLVYYSFGKRFFGRYEAVIHIRLMQGPNDELRYVCTVYAYPENGFSRFFARHLGLVERYFNDKTEHMDGIISSIAGTLCQSDKAESKTSARLAESYRRRSACKRKANVDATPSSRF